MNVLLALKAAQAEGRNIWRFAADGSPIPYPCSECAREPSCYGHDLMWFCTDCWTGHFFEAVHG